MSINESLKIIQPRPSASVDLQSPAIAAIHEDKKAAFVLVIRTLLIAHLEPEDDKMPFESNFNRRFPGALQLLFNLLAALLNKSKVIQLHEIKAIWDATEAQRNPNGEVTLYRQTPNVANSRGKLQVNMVYYLNRLQASKKRNERDAMLEIFE